MKKPPAWDKINIKRTSLLKWGIIVITVVFSFSPLAILRFICLVFISILAISGLYTLYLVKNIRAVRMDTELRSFRHEWTRVEIKIENHGFLPAFMLVAGDLPGDLDVFRMQKKFRTIPRRSLTHVFWDGLSSRRGVFSVGPAVINGTDPLGLFPFQLTSSETTRLYVYPVPKSISLENTKGIPIGNILSNNPLYEDITRRRSLRPYRPGDERRRINWKASARTADLMVNEYENAASYPLMIFLNVNKEEYPLKNRGDLIERVIEAAAALCLKASSERQELGIIIYLSGGADGITIINPSVYSLVPALECLAALDWRKPPDASPPAEIAHNGTIIMLNQGKYLSYGTRYIYTGPDLGDDNYITLNSLKRQHLFPEYLVISERRVSSKVPGGSPRYQIKESGYEII